jgi:hypothetical protein
MLSARLIQMIEAHAESLTQEAVDDILTSQHTRSLGRFSKAELRPRIFAFYRNLGSWIGNPNEGPVQLEYEEVGRIRRRQAIPLSEIIYTLIIIKKHLGRYIHDHGLITFSGDRIVPGELIPFQLYSLQELNDLVGDFFDRALYHLARGYEMEATEKHLAA